MALSEQEELELLELEKERAGKGSAKPSPLMEHALGLSRSMIAGGPMFGLISHGMKTGSDLADKAAYKAGEAVTDLTGSPAAGYATNVAIQAVPAVLSGGPAKSLAPALEGPARSLMQSALKPSSKSLVNGDAAKAIDTMLQEGVNATTGGAAKLRILINKLKAEVGQVISQSPATVDRGYAYKELAGTLEDVTKKGSGYNADRAAVLKAWDEFKNHPLLDKFAEVDNQIPIQSADMVKRASQKAAESAYSALTPPTASDKAQMAIAAGLRKGMEAEEPRVAAMNAKLSEYINALQQIEPRAAAAANRDIGGLVPLAHSPEAAMLMLADRNPWMKSFIARALYAGKEQIPATAARAGVAIGVSANNKQ